jgi:hypothetical protein
MMAASGLKRPLPAAPDAATTFAPRMTAGEREAMRTRWRDAVGRAVGTSVTNSSKAPDHTDRTKGELV